MIAYMNAPSISNWQGRQRQRQKQRQHRRRRLSCTSAVREHITSATAAGRAVIVRPKVTVCSSTCPFHKHQMLSATASVSAKCEVRGVGQTLCLTGVTLPHPKLTPSLHELPSIQRDHCHSEQVYPARRSCRSQALRRRRLFLVARRCSDDCGDWQRPLGERISVGGAATGDELC